MKIFVFLCVACLVSSLPIADGAGCFYYACDAAQKKCAVVDGTKITVKECASGTYCLEEGGEAKCATAPPAPTVCQVPGYKTSGNQTCCATKEGNYCKGLAKDGSCTGTRETLCDVGLWCNAGKCDTLPAKGAPNCTAFCQPSEVCLSGKCVARFTLDDGADNVIDEALCKSGHTFAGKCQAAEAYKGADVWFPVDKALADLCEFEKHKEPGVCAIASGNKDKAVYCRKYDSTYISSQDGYKALLTGFTDGSCMGGDLTCDKFLDAYGCTKAKDAMKSAMKFNFEAESLNPSCIPKASQALLDARFKCFGSELVWGILSVLAIVLLIQVWGQSF